VLRFEYYLLSTLPLSEALAAQLHLRQLLGHVYARILPPPELLAARAHERFDAGLRLKDEGTRRVLTDLLVRFSRWIGRERVTAEAERELAKKVPL
jgi:hypothetical protein